jgi:hypothetical protein
MGMLAVGMPSCRRMDCQRLRLCSFPWTVPFVVHACGGAGFRQEGEGILARSRQLMDWTGPDHSAHAMEVVILRNYVAPSLCIAVHVFAVHTTTNAAAPGQHASERPCADQHMAFVFVLPYKENISAVLEVTACHY